MNKTELLALLEGRLGSRRAATDALESVLAEITQAVVAGDRVTLTGFGTFERVERPARTGRNPQTGAPIEIAASAAPRFHPGTTLRAAVAGTASAPVAPRAVRARRTAANAAASGTTTASGSAAPAKAAKPAKKSAAKPATKPAKAATPVTAAKVTSKSAKKSAKDAKAAKSGKKAGHGKGGKANANSKKK